MFDYNIFLHDFCSRSIYIANIVLTMDASKVKSIRDNAMEVDSYLKDLHNWEQDIRKKDQELIALEKGSKPNWKRKVRILLLSLVASEVC